ncbi:MAG: ATP-dependent zinc metalloprotease FtsH [Armatimonadota bacterium]|nr:ATP-dependent zinc metalloprotease FtsH [Armatimonadota bacterium]
MNSRIRTLFITVVLLVGLIYFMSTLRTGGIFSTPPRDVSFSQFKADVAEGLVADVKWQRDKITAEYKDKSEATVNVFHKETPGGANLATYLDEQRVKWNFKDPMISDSALGILITLLVPAGLIFAVWFLFYRSAQANGNQALSFGRSKARRVNESVPKVTFEDVAGIDEARAELEEIVDFLKSTKKYVALGAKIPKGVLLTGPPGCGKTHLARAVAGEAGVPFFHISGSDFVEMFVGVGAARVRDLFETAKAHRPSLIFVDEIDAVGRQRGAGLGGGHDEREQTLNQLLVEMDGFDPNTGVIMIAATNRPDVLDPALLRPGRFDRQIVVDAPDAKGREEILKIHAKGKPFDESVNLATIAKRTVGFTGADLANTLNEGALLAARRDQTKIDMPALEEALDRVIAGPQRKSRIMDPQEREIIAYHEAGHAVVGELLEHADPVHKVTILPRGMSLGSTWQLPDSDKYLVSKTELMDDITALLAGRVAEELVYQEVTTGASNDLERVARIAKAMVCQYGMSEKLGTLALGRRSHNPFLGRDYMDERDYSEDIARQIDDEVREIVDTCHTRAQDILQNHRDKLDRVVKALLERETIEREEFLEIMGKTAESAPAATKPEPDPQEPAERKEGFPAPKLKPGTAES